MANILPVLIAFILNCLGYHIFLTPIHYPASPFMSGLIFSVSIYLNIVQYELYPLRLRRLPITLTRIYEFFGSLLLLEFTSSIAWFPLETFCFISLLKLASSIKVYLTPTKSRILNYMVYICQDCRSGIFLSYFLSISSLLITLHATYIADFKLLREGKVRTFVEEIFCSGKEAFKQMVNIEYYKRLVRKKSSCKRRQKKSKCRKL